MPVSKKDCILTQWDIVDSLDSDEAVAAYLDAVVEDNDPKYMLKAINNVARAYGINSLAKKMGVTREGLYKSLNGTTKPRFETIYKILNALGMRFKIELITPPQKTSV